MPGQTLPPIAIARDVYRKVRQFPRVLKNPSPLGLAASSDAISRMPVGLTYHWIDIVPTVSAVAATKAQIISDIERVRFVIDGDPMVDASGEELVMLQERYCQRAGADPVGDLGHLFVDLARPWQREISGEDDPAWGTRDVGTFEVIVRLASGASIDACSLRSGVTDGENMGRHWTLRRRSFTQSASGRQSIQDWQRDIGSALLALHVKKATLTDVLLKVDNVDEIDCEYAVLARRGLQYERANVSGWSHLDFAMRNRLQDALPMVAQTTDLQLVWSSAPNNYDMLMEMIEGPADAA